MAAELGAATRQTPPRKQRQSPRVPAVPRVQAVPRAPAVRQDRAVRQALQDPAAPAATPAAEDDKRDHRLFEQMTKEPISHNTPISPQRQQLLRRWFFYKNLIFFKFF